MKLIKDKKIIDDNWTFIADNEPIPAGDISVSLTRWRSEKEQLLKHEGNLGIRLKPDEELEEIVADLDKFKLVELEFPVYTDGRNFSRARLLRSRYHYNGELRATGQFMRDQIFYLYRVGFNAMALENTADLEEALTAFDDFTVTYQPDVSTLFRTQNYTAFC
jgi:uncharacterized protein (DUF934 family)